MEYKDFLLEINVEELPAGHVRPAVKELQRGFAKFEWDILNDTLKTGATKNSLILYAKNVPAEQKKDAKKFYGPPKKVMFDADGNATKQAIGFAKKHGVKVGDLNFENTAKGEYVVIEKKEPARKTKDILREIIPGVIKDVKFQKTMRWDDSGLRFARPIESILALFGNEKLEIELDGIPQKDAGRVAASQYLKRLKFIDADKRKKEIRRLISQAIRKLKTDEVIDENLLEEVTFLVNQPAVFFGSFNEKFLELPADVLKASMAKHQRVFPVSKNGRLVNKFIAVLDGKKDVKRVRRNYERILDAKLQDSLFFFKEDTKKPLEENISQLKDLIFQKDLGNMFGKIERLKELCGFISEKLNLDSSLKKDTQRAAMLSKTDLTTHMVGEFPSLQGVMGCEYALKSGETKEVTIAIKEQYLPQGVDDRLPETLRGSILAISDRIDNIVGFLGMGVEASGSFDPFGIRRNAQGLIQIIKNKSLRIKIDELIEKSIELYGATLKLNSKELKEKIIDYIIERIDFLMGEAKPTELKAAVLGTRCLDVVDVFNRFGQLLSIATETYFLQAAKVVERTSNILKGAKKEKIGTVNEKLFKDDLERKVWGAYLNSKDKIATLIDKEEYKEATREYAGTFYQVLHDFFDKVMINVEDTSLRQNRLAIMKEINKLYVERVADLAKLPQIVVR